jgi:isopentenyldiphosphate isomerase
MLKQVYDRRKHNISKRKTEQIGLMPKLEAHEKAVLHRAILFFVLNSNEIMLQQRAKTNIILLYYGLSPI